MEAGVVGPSLEVEGAGEAEAGAEVGNLLCQVAEVVEEEEAEGAEEVVGAVEEEHLKKGFLSFPLLARLPAQD